MRVATVVLLIVVLFAMFERDRLFIHDPFASVYRNNVKQSDVEVYFNFANEILLQQNHGDIASTRTILQHWDMMPATPASLTCLRPVLCMTPADHAPTLPAAANGGKAYDPKVSMDGRDINYTDPAGVQVRVKL